MSGNSTVLEKGAMQSLPKLHLGCFDQILPGWINTDITPHIRIARIPALPLLLLKLGLMPQQRYDQHRQGIFRNVNYLDATRRFPYPDGSIACVYSSHMLEHIHRDEALFCLREIHRVLVIGGCVRLAVPDLDALVGGYNSNNPDKFLDTVFEVGHKRDKNRHHWLYNENSLRKLLQEAGFTRIRRCQFREGQSAGLYLADMRPESLFMEAAK